MRRALASPINEAASKNGFDPSLTAINGVPYVAWTEDDGTNTSSESGSTFECKLNRGKFKPCSSPRKLKHLDPGKEKFKVRATDAAGNVDLSPVKDKFKVL